MVGVGPAARGSGEAREFMTSVVSRVTIDNPDNLVGRAPSRPDPLAGPMPDAGVRRGPREAVNDSFWASSANRTETNFPFDGKVSFFFCQKHNRSFLSCSQEVELG